MAKAYPRKRMSDFLSAKQTNAYLEALSSDTGISVSQLLTVNKGNSASFDQGTWAHAEVAVKFAAWLSPEFEVWAMRTLVQVIQQDAKLETEPAAPALPAVSTEERIGILTNSLEKLGLLSSVRHMQLARDRVANLMGEEQAALPDVKWRGVVEIAESLGYDACKIKRYSSQLGKMVAAWHRTEIGDEPTTEDRIVNGRMCSLKVYRPSEELETMISAYLNSKGLEAA